MGDNRQNTTHGTFREYQTNASSLFIQQKYKLDEQTKKIQKQSFRLNRFKIESGPARVKPHQARSPHCVPGL